MLQRALALTGFFLILGCAHVLKKDGRLDPSLLPPNEKQIAEHPEQANVIWWTTFRKAETALEEKNREVACLSYRKLSSEKLFPLRDLAVLRAREICPGIDDLHPVESLDPRSVTWFEESAIRGKKNHFRELSPEEQIRLLWDQARLEKDDRKRETLFMDALGLAEKQSEASLLKDARQKLWKNSPRLHPSPDRKELASVANDYRRSREFSKAVQIEKNRLAKQGVLPEEKFNVLKSIRQTWKVAQKKDEMLAATTELLRIAQQDFRRHKKDSGAIKRLLEARTLYARTLWTEERRDLAINALKEARRELSGLISMEEVEFLNGRLAEEVGKLPEAEGHFANALKETPLIPGLREKILWARGWILHKMGQKKTAAEAFQTLADTTKDLNEKQKALFWRSRNLENEDRNTLLRQIRTEDPLGYYGMMASRDLKEPLLPVKAQDSSVDLSLWNTPEMNLQTAIVAEWLMSVDWKEGLVRVLDSLQGDLRKVSKPESESWLRLVSAYARAGEYLPLFTLMGTLSPDVRDRLLKERPDLLFPRPWLFEVSPAAVAADLPPELIYSIMRQESAFNPRARSGAEAYGLMQLLPEVASTLAKTYHVASYKGPESLYEPPVAIRLGAFELRRLLDRWQGRWIPAIASYNANHEAVQRWLKIRYREDSTEFIEEIPYEETRAYVKLVLRNQVFYQRLASTKPTEFPEKCLEIVQSSSPAQ